MYFQPLESRTLFAAGGTGLIAHYFNNQNFTGTEISRLERSVNFNWGRSSPDAKIAGDTFSARWTGQIKPAHSETYSFKVISDDGVRLWVNHKPVISNWGPTGLTTSVGKITLVAGKKYDIQIEYREKTGSARVALYWSSPSTPEAIVPGSRLFPAEQNLRSKIDHAIAFAQGQLKQTLLDLKGNVNRFPSITSGDGTWKTYDYTDWTAGFFGGALWQMYNRTIDKQWRLDAAKYTTSLLKAKAAGDDLGFRFIPTYLQYHRTMGVDKLALVDAAASKMANFSSKVGMFKSVNFKTPETKDPRANFPVLMDHTMDLELVYEAAGLVGNSGWIAKANQHLDKLTNFMVRADGSTVQWGYFYDQTGEFIAAETRQGISGNTTWSRGQAWAMYSFVTAGVMQNSAKYLATAKKISDYWIAHTRSDGVPYWDFNAPDKSTTPVDSSAAAVAASALIKLASYYRGTADGDKYRAVAEKILNSLTSPAYLAEGSNSRGILLHGAKYFSQGIYDNSLIYGDYYFLEALNRYATLPL